MKNCPLILYVFLSVLLAAVSYSDAASKAGQVLTVRKDVYVIRADEKEKAAPQMDILESDVVETGKGSRAKLFFIDDSILSLGEMSRVEIQEYKYSPEKQRSKSIYRLMDGALKVVVGRSDLEIHTPTAVAAARGTQFMMLLIQVDGVLLSRLIVTEGEVLVRSIVEGIVTTVNVSVGQMVDVPLDAPPGDVVPAVPVPDGAVVVIGNIDSSDTDPEQLPVVEPQMVVIEPELPSVPPVVEQTPVDITPVTINLVF